MATKLRMQVSADPDSRFLSTVAKLKAAGRGDLQRQMTAKLRRRGQPALNAVRASLRAADLPAKPSRGGSAATGLRDKAAKATTLSATAKGLRILVNGDKVDPAYGTSLVLALNGLTRLRHPVFGNRSAWVNQRGSKERFYSALEPFQAQWRRDAEQVLDEYAAKLGG